MLNKRKFSGIVIAGTLILSSAFTTFAVVQTSKAQSSTSISNPYKSALDSLVTAGTITQAQADAVLNALPSNGGSSNSPQGQPGDFLSSLVTTGTITQTQADTIKAAMESARTSGKTMEDTINSLVTAGTITQTQADAVLKALPSNNGPNSNAGPSNSPQGQPGDFLSSLVTAGTITQAQADAVLKALPSNNGPNSNAGSSNKPQGQSWDFLSSLVTAGTITQTQADAIKEALQKVQGEPNGLSSSGGTGNISTVTGTAVYTQSGKTVTKKKQNITSSKKDESVIKVTKSGTLTLTNSTITKKSGDTSSEESSNFTGLNAAILAESSSKINISNSKITTSADGSNAVFATGKGSTINISNTTINTTKNSSRGLDATYNGTIIAKNVNITTKGAHCAAIATDRGEGTITVTGGTMNTAGEGSPGIYSTGNITVIGANLKATGSEAAVIEGKNSITLKNTTLYGAVKHGVMLYQSFSGDADVGTSKFDMTGGSLTAAAGPLFYSTNTSCIINLKNVTLKGSSGILLKASSDRWGTSGSNGADVTFNADTQTLNGNIVCDNISTIKTVLKNNSTLKGSINAENTAKSVSLTLDKTSKWNVTGNSYLTSLTDDDSTLSNIDDNGYTIYYDSSNSANSWLNNETYTLKDGGKLTPIN